MQLQDLGSRLRAFREAKGLTKYRLAKLFGVSQTYIYRIEKGEIENPRRDTLQKLAGGCGITLAQLAGDISPSDTWGLVEQSLKAWIPVYSGVGDIMEPTDYVACTRSEVPPTTVRAFRSKGLCLNPYIKAGDTVIVDSALTPRHGDLVVGTADGLATIMRYSENHEGEKWFTDKRGRFKPDEVEVQGIVTDFQRKLR